MSYQKKKIVISGTGEPIEKPLANYKSPFVLLYSAFDRDIDIALLQGSMAIGVAEFGLALRFNTLYCQTFGDPHRRNVTWDTYDRMLDYMDMREWERDAFQYARVVFSYCHQRVIERYGNEISFPQTRSKDIQQVMEVTFRDLDTFKQMLRLELNSMFRTTGRLRDLDSQYRFVGLEAEVDGKYIPCSSALRLPRSFREKEDFIITAEVSPTTSEGQIASPYADRARTSVLSGLIHGFEGRTKWNERCSLHSAVLDYIASGNWTTNELIAACSRSGAYPRLSSYDRENNPMLTDYCIRRSL